MSSIILPKTDIINLKSTLINKYNIEIPIFSWENLNLIRISYQIYNTQKDIEHLLDALKKIILIK